MRPWSRSADRQMSSLDSAELILSPLRVPKVPMETLLVPPTNGWHWPCQGQGWRHRHGKELFRGAGPAFHTVQAPQFTCERTDSPTWWEAVL